MKKKLLTYILVFIMLLGLPACGHTTESGIQPIEKAGTILISLNLKSRSNTTVKVWSWRFWG